jgi:DNA-binding Lrp family transcriptional regulator
MVFVYILGKVETGNETEVLNSFKNAEQVERASLTYGTYDLCIEAHFKTMEELDDFVFNVVRKTPGITETATLVAAKTISKES